MQPPKPDSLHPELWSTHTPTIDDVNRLGLGSAQKLTDAQGTFKGVWMTGSADELNQLWVRCAQQFPQTGLWPILSKFDDTFVDMTLGLKEWDRFTRTEDAYWVPTDAFQTWTFPSRLGSDSVEGVIQIYKDAIADELGWQAHWTPAEPAKLPEQVLADVPAPLIEPESLALIACWRPAEVIIALDFGIANEDALPGMFWGVLSGWEERFAVVPVCLDYDWTSFACLVPPSDELNAQRLAEEVNTFAADSSAQGGIYSELGGDKRLFGARQWEIWWD